MFVAAAVAICRAGRTPSRGAWIEMWMLGEALLKDGGRTPSRGAWIEMTHSPQILQHDKSHPLAGCVD